MSVTQFRVSADVLRRGTNAAAKGSADYVAAMLRAYRHASRPGPPQGPREYPFLYDTAWNIMHLIDWIETRPEADASRIGMIGFSKGGMETYLAAAADARVRVPVPCIGVQSFHWAIHNNAWQSRAGTSRPLSTPPPATNDPRSTPPCFAAFTIASPLGSIPNSTAPPCSPSSSRAHCSSSTAIPTRARRCQTHGVHRRCHVRLPNPNRRRSLPLRAPTRHRPQSQSDSLTEAIEWFERWLKPATC